MAKSVAFNKLNSLNLTKRMEAARQPGTGTALLSLLTPSEFADLFPRYYQRQLPDVGGFQLAISRKSKEQQEEASRQLQDRLIGIERDAAEQKKSFTQRIKDYFTQKKPAGLSPEQLAAWQQVQKGDVTATSDAGKIFSKLTSKELNSVGITLEIGRAHV